MDESVLDRRLTTAELAELFGVTPSRVRQLIADDIISREADGRFHLATVCGQYFMALALGRRGRRE